jgi:enoyl-CoA hydratase/carnithine racemase
VNHEIRVEVSGDHVATVEFGRGPRNHFDATLIAGLADAFEHLDADANARAIVLCSSGRHFCAGADLPGALHGGAQPAEGTTGSLYEEAVRLIASRTPIAVAGDEAARIGLCDRLAPDEALRSAAHEFAAQIAASAPLAVVSIRQTLRGDLADRVRAATAKEQSEQASLAGTADFIEGVSATAERREPRFTGS